MCQGAVSCNTPPPHYVRPQLGEMWSGPKAADTDYARVKAMLKALNLSVRGCGGE